MTKLITAILLIFVWTSSYGQSGELGLFAGSSYYTGDLNPGKPFKMSLPAFGAFYRYNFNNRLSLRPGFFTTRLQGNDFQGRGLAFRSNLHEFSAQLEVNFYEFGLQTNESPVTPYLFAGMGYTWFNSRSFNNGVEKVDLQMSATSFPFGLGVKYSPWENVNMGLEWGLRKTAGTNADKIDAIYEPGTRISAASDWYALVGAWISFKLNFFQSERCEELRIH